MCQPGQAADPCVSNLAATTVTAGGTLNPATWPHSAAASKFACFYVHPTDSLAKTANTGLAPTKLDIYVATEQAAPLSQVCDVWAPSYRSQTWPTVEKGLAGDKAVMRPTFTVAYDSVLPAWQWFLAHTEGKPIVLVGDSQGSAILIHLISAQLDHEPSVLRRLLVADPRRRQPPGPCGQDGRRHLHQGPVVHLRLPRRGARSPFRLIPPQPPADSQFGRPGQGVSLQSGQTAKAGQQVACVNPAALSGGTGRPRPLPAHGHPDRPVPDRLRAAERACLHLMGHLPRPLLGDL